MMQAKSGILKPFSILAIFSLLFTLASINICAQTTELESLLQSKGISETDMKDLIHVLSLRQNNRNQIQSLQVEFAQMIYRSDIELEKQSNRQYKGFVPADEIPNPEIQHTLIKKDAGVHYGFFYQPIEIVPHFPQTDKESMPEGIVYYTPIEKNREFIKKNSALVSLDQASPLVKNTHLLSLNEEGVICESDKLNWMTRVYDFYPEIHETHTLEQKVDDIAYATAALTDLFMDTAQNGKPILTLLLQYPNNELHNVSYSLEDNGLMMSQEIISSFKDKQGVHERKLEFTTTAFYSTTTEDGSTVSLPLTSQKTLSIDNQFRKNTILLVDKDSILVNQPLETDQETLSVAMTQEKVDFWYYPKEKTLSAPGFYNRYDTLPSRIKPLVRISKKPDQITMKDPIKKYNQQMSAIASSNTFNGKPPKLIASSQPILRIYDNQTNKNYGLNTLLISGIVCLFCGPLYLKRRNNFFRKRSNSTVAN
ncbi:hypothetical protein GF373_11985 [bacterium]|nr:hypothetical protein [bacterium]